MDSVMPSPALRFKDRRFIVTMLLCAVIYLPSLAWTLGLDQNIFAVIASLLLKGKRLYVDAWDVKPPNVFYTYAAFEWLFGQTEFAIRLSDYLFTMLAAAALFIGVDDRLRSAKSDRSQCIAPIATILLTLTLLSLGSADTAQTESYSLFFIIGAAVLSFRRRTMWLLLAGVMLAVATFYKTTNALFLLPIAIEIILLERRRAIKPLALIILGLIAWSAIQTVVLAMQGSLESYLWITSSVAAHHADEISDFSFVHFWRILWVYADIWLIAAIAGVICAILCKDRSLFRALRLPLLFVLAGLLIVILQNKGWGYHYVVIIPGLVAFCSIALLSVLRWFKRIPDRLIVAVACVALLGFWGKSLWRAMPQHNAKLSYLAITDRPVYLSWFGRAHTLYHPPQTMALTNYVKQHTLPSDPIFILGDEPGVYWRADREPATKFVYALLMNSGVIASDEIRAMNDTLARIKPRIIAVERFDTTGFRGKPETSESTLNTDPRFEPLRSLLLSQYSVANTVGDNFIIYRRRD
jgi:hypothetical protein